MSFFPKSTGNYNYLPDFTADNATITNLNVANGLTGATGSYTYIATTNMSVSNGFTGSTGSFNNLTSNRIQGATGTITNLTATRIQGSTGSFTSLDNVSYINGNNGGYLEFTTVGAPPIVRAIAGNNWQLGASHSSDLNKQISIGYATDIDRGLIYAFDQGGGSAKNQQYGYPSFPVTHYFEGSLNTTANITGLTGSFTNMIATTTRTNNITSIGTNDNLTIDANGTGKILVNTIQSRGLVFGTDTTGNITDQVCYAPGGDTTKNCLIMGVINRAGLSDYLPFIGAQIPSVSWANLRLNHSAGSVIYAGDITVADSTYNTSTYKNIFVGACNIHTGGSLAIAGNAFVDASRNLTLGSGTITTSGAVSTGAITCTSINGNSIFSPAYIHVYYDSYPFNLYTAGSVIAIGTTTLNASNMSVSSDAIFLPSGASGKYKVNLSIPVYKESAIQLYDGNNNAITGTYFVGGNPTLDAESVLVSPTFIISQPALDKFTIRASSNAWVGRASSGINANVSLHVTVLRIA